MPGHLEETPYLGSTAVSARWHTALVGQESGEEVRLEPVLEEMLRSAGRGMRVVAQGSFSCFSVGNRGLVLTAAG